MCDVAKQLLAAPGYIFDLDGVLVDTAVFHYQAWKRLANTLGFDFTEVQNEELKGISRRESLDKILQWGGLTKTEAELADLATSKNSWYLELVEGMTPDDVLPGVLTFLQAAQRKGKKIALGSASKNAPFILEKTGISEFFDAIVDGNAVTLSKPNPEVFLRAAQKIDLAPADCVVFEDAQAGVDAALAAGMGVIGIAAGNGLSGAPLCVSSLGELL